MREYTPDSWIIVQIESEQYGKINKILAGWSGGYTTGNSWKLSSGIESVQDEGKFYTMPQSSGSVYHLYKQSERITGMMSGVFEKFAKQAEDSDGEFTFKQIELKEVL